MINSKYSDSNKIELLRNIRAAFAHRMMPDDPFIITNPTHTYYGHVSALLAFDWKHFSTKEEIDEIDFSFPALSPNGLAFYLPKLLIAVVDKEKLFERSNFFGDLVLHLGYKPAIFCTKYYTKYQSLNNLELNTLSEWVDWLELSSLVEGKFVLRSEIANIRRNIAYLESLK